VTRTARAPRRPVVFATDFSPASGPAFRAAVAWVRRSRAPLELVHVLVPPSPFVLPRGMTVPTWQDLEARARQAARKRIAQLGAMAARSGVRVRTSLLPVGTPDEEVVRVARRRNAELVVIGTHGRTGMQRALTGSVAERVVRSAACPVLTVRGTRAGARCRARAPGGR